MRTIHGFVAGGLVFKRMGAVAFWVVWEGGEAYLSPSRVRRVSGPQGGLPPVHEAGSPLGR